MLDQNDQMAGIFAMGPVAFSTRDAMSVSRVCSANFIAFAFTLAASCSVSKIFMKSCAIR